jgi:hypothetical protein
VIDFLLSLDGRFLFGIVVGALVASAFWRAALLRYMSNPVNARKLAAKLRAKGY